MSIIPWIRKVCGRTGNASSVCQDTLTRLGSRELAALQDAGRNSSISARVELKAAMRHMLKASMILDEMERRMRDAGEK